MARKKRIWYPGAVYHVMARGNQRRSIYHDEEDRLYFLLLLQVIAVRKPYVIHSYCLMSNHFHLLIETKEDEIWNIMHLIMRFYSGYYNHKYHTDGHVFKGRYFSCLVEDDAYFLHVSRYIHLNPVKAKMVQHPEDYKWSSYNRLIGLDLRGWPECQKLLSYFPGSGAQDYRFFVEGNAASSEDYEERIQKSIRDDDTCLPEEEK